MPISSIDRELILQSMEAKAQSHDPDRQVGVVIANQENHIISVGTNAPPDAFGFYPAKSHEAIASDPKWKYYLLEHAERNAIFTALKGGHSLLGATMYGTLFPCADCARAIVASGITRLVVPNLGAPSLRDEKWLEHYKYAQEIFDLAGVEVESFDAVDDGVSFDS